MTPFAPMLATSKRVAAVPLGWAIEPKLDGWRAVVAVRSGRLVVRSRRGSDLTDRIPELWPLSVRYRTTQCWTGSLVAGDGRASDFYALGPRLLSRSRAARARWEHVAVAFHAFDLLLSSGTNLCGSSWSDRRAALEALDFSGPAWGTVPLIDAELEDALTACAAIDLEGLVLKRQESIYRPGERSKDWVKVKTPDWRTNHGARRHDAPASG